MTNPTSTATSIYRGPAAATPDGVNRGSFGRSWVGCASGGGGVLSPHLPVSAWSRGRLSAAATPLVAAFDRKRLGSSRWHTRATSHLNGAPQRVAAGMCVAALVDRRQRAGRARELLQDDQREVVERLVCPRADGRQQLLHHVRRAAVGMAIQQLP